MKRIAIERKNRLVPAEFSREHLAGTGKPVVVTDAMDGWAARPKWDFKFFKSAYGSDFVSVPLGLKSEITKLTKLAIYIDYLDAPTAELPGFWLDRRADKPLAIESLPLPGLHYPLLWNALRKHPELYCDFEPPAYFIADWQLALNPAMREAFESASGLEYFSIYIGPEGGVSRLHQDFWHTHAYLAQICGRKHCVLFSPQDSEFLYDGAVDPEQPDFERFGLLRHATAYECVIEPGDMLFIPPNWWHQVRCLDKTITLSHNFFNDLNFNEHLTRVLKEIARSREPDACKP